MEGKKLLKAFLEKPSVKELINKNKFQEVYKEWNKFGGNSLLNENILTDIFIQAEINFLPYMSYIPKFCFKGIELEEIDIPINILIVDAYAICNMNNLTDIFIHRKAGYGTGPDLIRDSFYGLRNFTIHYDGDSKEWEVYFKGKENAFYNSKHFWISCSDKSWEIDSV